MQLNTSCILPFLNKNSEYKTYQETYSPFCSNIGICAREEERGIGELFLHYNRSTRSVWQKFANFPYSINKAESRFCALVFGKGEQKGSLSFYDTDCIIAEFHNTQSVTLFAEGSDKLTDFWNVRQEGDTLLYGGYSKNTDDRDPDETVPVMAGVRLIKGSVRANTLPLTLESKDNSIVFAFVFETLEPTAESILHKLRNAPVNAEQGERCAEQWVTNMLCNLSISAEKEEEITLIARALGGLLQNLTKAPGNLAPFISSFPNRGTYPTHFLWDSCFQNLAYEIMNPDLARDSILCLVATQRRDGKYGQFNCSTWIRPHYTQPALVGWAALRYAKQTGDTEFIKQVLPSLEKNNTWWLTSRMTPSGLICCPHGLETGQDDSPRFDKGTTISADMNSYLLNQMYATASLAQMVNDTQKATYWKARADAFGNLMAKILYDEEAGIFFDRMPNTMEPVKIVASSDLLPLWAGVPITKEKTKMMIEKYLVNPEYLFGNIPFPSIAYNEPVYEAHAWWRGPTWLPIAWLMVETLLQYGYEKQAKESAKRLYNMIVKDRELHELFNSQTGEGLGSVEQGWSCAIFLRLCKELFG